jgi:hypothetical protein
MWLSRAGTIRRWPLCARRRARLPNMPAKGGTTWPDATIRMTVDYMVSLNK